jgi:hypothetical protein
MHNICNENRECSPKYFLTGMLVSVLTVSWIVNVVCKPLSLILIFIMLCPLQSAVTIPMRQMLRFH